MNSKITKIIEIKNLTKYYGKNKVLDIPYFCFYESFSYLLVGGNGAGKSTLIKLITKMIKASSGSISTNAKISYVPEKFSFPDSVSTFNFLDNLCKVRNKKGKLDQVNYLLKWWNIDKDKKINALSKGMKQKLLILQAIIDEADVYIFDEPLNGLDPTSQKDFIQILKNLKGLNKTIIVCTHYEKYYESFFDYYIYFNGGLIYENTKFN